MASGGETRRCAKPGSTGLPRDPAYRVVDCSHRLCPRASPSDGISLEPVFFRYLSSRFCLTSGMAIIASSHLDDIPISLLGFLVQRLYLTDRGYLVSAAVAVIPAIRNRQRVEA